MISHDQSVLQQGAYNGLVGRMVAQQGFKGAYAIKIKWFARFKKAKSVHSNRKVPISAVEPCLRAAEFQT